MIDEKYVEFAVEQTLSLLRIDSPSGYTQQAAEACLAAFRELGFEAHLTGKGGGTAVLFALIAKAAAAAAYLKNSFRKRRMYRSFFYGLGDRDKLSADIRNGHGSKAEP